MATTTIVVNTTDLPQTCPEGYEFSLTGNANDWQTSNIFLDVPVGQTYIVRVRSKCTDCVYSKEVIVDTAVDVLCPCESKIDKINVVNHPSTSCSPATHTLNIQVTANECCVKDGEVVIRLPFLPFLPTYYTWNVATIVAFNTLGYIEATTVNGMATFSLDYDQVQAPLTILDTVGYPGCATCELCQQIPIPTSIVKFVFTGCGCTTDTYTVDVAFGGCATNVVSPC